MLRLVARWQVSTSGALQRLWRQEGQTMTEYGIVLAVVALVVFVALTTLSTSIRGAMTSVASILTG